MSIGKQVAQAAAAADGGQPRLEVGLVIGIDWTTQTAQVNIGGGIVEASMAGQEPILNTPVWVLRLAGKALTLGIVARPASGTVTVDAADGRVGVETAGGAVYQLPFDTSIVPGVDDLVAIDWGAGGFIAAVLTDVNSAPPAYQPPNPGAGAEQERVFVAADSASFNGATWQTGDVIFGQSWPAGAWFYGTQIADSIPDTATIIANDIYVRCTTASGANLQLGTHTYDSRPPGGMTVFNLTEFAEVGDGFEGWLSLPLAWGEDLKTGTAKGIATSGAGFKVLAGLQVTSGSGSLRIRWRG